MEINQLSRYMKVIITKCHILSQKVEQEAVHYAKNILPFENCISLSQKVEEGAVHYAKIA